MAQEEEAQADEADGDAAVAAGEGDAIAAEKSVSMGLPGKPVCSHASCS